MKYLYTISLCLIFALFGNVSITNAQLSKTQCPATCPRGQQCIKKADGYLDCRETATNCNPACTSGKVCVKATATATAGTCVDAPANSTNPTGLLQGLQQFQRVNSGLNTGGTLIGYVANIIRWILGILGTVFFIIIVIQGFLYMTAGGDSGKTASAVGAIGNAVVGLLIIMGAFLITNFVTSALLASG